MRQVQQQDPQRIQYPERLLELVSDKTFRISWQPSTDAQFYLVLENADGASGCLPITGNLDASIQS